MPDISSPVGFLLGLVALAGILALVHTALSFLTSRSGRSSSTDRLTHELSRIATALESLVLQRQEAGKGEPQPAPPLGRSAPLDIPNTVFSPEVTEQKPQEEKSKKSGRIGLSMFGR